MVGVLHRYDIKGDFSTVAKSNLEFVERLQRSAHFLKDYQSMSIEDYMCGYAKRAWVLSGLVIRTENENIFVEDMINCGLLTKNVVQ